MLFGLASVSCCSVTSFDSSGGRTCGGAKARVIARNSVMRSTLRVVGYERVKMGWKMPAR
jgi:hypothetical protein